MADIKTQDNATLEKSLMEKREALRTFRFGGAGSRTRNVREGRNLRKEIAQILTELRAREIASEKKTA
jgi:ribosomal protein L29